MNAKTEAGARLRLLLGELRADRQALTANHRRVVEAQAAPPWLPEAPILAVVAVAVHHYYTAAESLFERIARAFEGLPAPGERWHRDLLHAMTVEVPGLRPRLLAPETANGLRELLAFRHFFHHAYAVELDPERLALVARTLVRTHGALAADLDAYERFIEAAGQA